MKTILILTTGLLAVMTTKAQQLVAFADVSNIESHESRSSHKRMNADYLDTVSFSESNETITQLQKKATNYRIDSSRVYDNSEPAIYDVTFRKGGNHLSVTYNNEGEILSSHETYYNLPLPNDLRITVSKQYPGWAFTKTKCELTYDRFKGGESTYSVTLKKGKKKMTLSDLASL